MSILTLPVGIPQNLEFLPLFSPHPQLITSENKEILPFKPFRKLHMMIIK